MKKLFLLLVLIALLPILSSCDDDRGGSYRDINFYTGSVGLEMRFLEGMPPHEIYVGDQGIGVTLEIYNKGTQYIGTTGANNVGDGMIRLSGFDTNYFNPTPVDGAYNFQAEGKSEYNPFGEIYTIKEFVNANPVTLSTGVSSLSQTIKATACYPYRTKSAEKICIDSDVRNLIKDKACQVHDVTTNGQGAPISITRIEEDIISGGSGHGDVIFKIYFSNTGGGDIYYDGVSLGSSVGLCDQNNLNYNHMNVIKLNHIRLGEGSDFVASCSPTTKRLTGNQGYIMCKCEGCVDPNLQAYETVLYTELEYGYRQSIQKNIKIVQIPQT